MNTLSYGDNLDVLRRHIKDETVDLIYLDPPFKSNQDYNVLFAERDGTGAASQFKAFEDTWEWNQAAAAGFYKSPWGSHPRLQILTIAELLEGKGIDYPHPSNVTFKRAPKALPEEAEQLTLVPSELQPRPRRRK